MALDPGWASVDEFLGGLDARAVVLGNHRAVEAALGVWSLPVTFLVEPGGHLSLRFDGPRSWSDQTFVERWIRSEIDQP